VSNKRDGGTSENIFQEKHHALQLYDYHVWANKKVFDRFNELPQDLYHKEIQNVFPSLSKVMAHIYIVDNLWLSVMRGDSFAEIMALVGRLPEETETKSLEEMESMFSDLSGRYKAFLMSQEDLDRTVSCEHPQYGRLETRLSELVQHVGTHGTYHRGNITSMLRQLGHPGVPTDYIIYLYAMNTSG